MYFTYTIIPTYYNIMCIMYTCHDKPIPNLFILPSNKIEIKVICIFSTKLNLIN